MGKIFELTGVPASGKSTYIKNNKLKVVQIDFLFPKSLFIPITLTRILNESFLLSVGFFRLPIKDLIFFFCISMKENVNLFTKFNIFRNTVRKFGIYFMSKFLCFDEDLYIDEGISHIPFNFLATNPLVLETRLSPYLKEIEVKIICCPNKSIVATRLANRGHSRLKFYKIENFINENLNVESYILSKYNFLCRSFEMIDNDNNL